MEEERKSILDWVIASLITFNSLNSPNFKLLYNENVPDLTLLLIIWQLIHQGKKKKGKKN